jgi:hypothetical protein
MNRRRSRRRQRPGRLRCPCSCWHSGWVPIGPGTGAPGLDRPIETSAFDSVDRGSSTAKSGCALAERILAGQHPVQARVLAALIQVTVVTTATRRRFLLACTRNQIRLNPQEWTRLWHPHLRINQMVVPGDSFTLDPQFLTLSDPFDCRELNRRPGHPRYRPRSWSRDVFYPASPKASRPHNFQN